MRDQAAAAFGDRLSHLQRVADRARIKSDRYRHICQRPATIGTGAPDETVPECQSLAADVSATSRTITQELADIDEAGRRAGIYPGVMRDLLATYGFK